LIEEHENGKANIYSSTAVRPEGMFKLMHEEEKLGDETKSPIDCQEINKKDVVEDIDDELALMRINAVSDSEEDPDEMVNPTKSDDISMKQPSEISNVSTSHQMAKRIVDQMKEILLQQFQKTFNRDQYIHEGIECSECHVIPIVGTRYKCTI
jgi:hypothetical protein